MPVEVSTTCPASLFFLVKQDTSGVCPIDLLSSHQRHPRATARATIFDPTNPSQPLRAALRAWPRFLRTRPEASIHTLRWPRGSKSMASRRGSVPVGGLRGDRGDRARGRMEKPARRLVVSNSPGPMNPMGFGHFHSRYTQMGTAAS